MKFVYIKEIGAQARIIYLLLRKKLLNNKLVYIKKFRCSSKNNVFIITKKMLRKMKLVSIKKFRCSSKNNIFIITKKKTVSKN